MKPEREAKQRAERMRQALPVIEGLENVDQINFYFGFQYPGGKKDDTFAVFFKDTADGEEVEPKFFRYKDPAAGWEPDGTKER